MGEPSFLKKRWRGVERQEPRSQLVRLGAGGGEAGGGRLCESAARPRERTGERRGESKKTGVNPRGRGPGGRPQVAWSGCKSHPRNVPHAHTRTHTPTSHTLALVGGETHEAREDVSVPRVCVCARVASFSTPLTPPHPQTPSPPHS